MALRKVRNNIDRLFDKNLTDLIRGIRNNKENEGRYIAACMEEIKAELRTDSPFIKANAIEKLAYLQMLGYDISWASFNIIEVMASTKYCEKRIGYLTATQCFNDETDVLMLTTNMIRKDLQSSNMYDCGVALSGLACFATSDLSRDLVNDVVNLLTSSRPYVRKKAVLLLYKVFLKYPESLRPTFSRLKEKLEDPDSGVQSAAVNVICELARKNPRNYLSLAPLFFKLMTTSSNNWMLIKIIKLFGSLVPLESRLGKKLLEPLTTLINSTSAMSLLYECINTVIAVLISISTEGPGDYTPSIQLCVQKLGVLIEDSDQNLKYLGLLAMGRILLTHPKAVQAHKDIVLRCLDDKDESIRLRALDLLYGMVSKKNIMEIVRKLMDHVDKAEGAFYRDELLARIISICSHKNYQYITNFEWYISVLVELTKVEGSKHGVLIGEQIQDVTVRVQSIRHYSVSQMALLVENAHLLLSANSAQRNNISAVLLAAAWICGEYAEHVNDITSVLESMLKTKVSLVPGDLLSVYIQNIAKLYAFLLVQYEKEADWDAIESLDNLVLSKLPQFQYSEHLEAQERACNLLHLLKFVESEHMQKKQIAEAFSDLFVGELNPVAAKAQRKVPLPEGLDLDQWIVEPLESESEEDEEPEEMPSIDTARRQFALAAESYMDSSEEEHLKPKKNGSEKKKKVSQKEIEESKERRKFEQENNPYYMKSVVKPMQKSQSNQSQLSQVSKRVKHQSPPDLQSPLEIPGVIGMDRYLEQQNSTISWKTAKVEKQKKTKKGIKKKKKTKAQTLSVLSSSEEEDEAVVVHNVNRDDGEMPENALSSDDEKDMNGVSDEFKALDMDLDAPLRDDEQLFAPRPYERPKTFSQDRFDAFRLPINDKTEPKKKKKKEKEKEKASEDKKKTKKKKKKANDDNLYTAIDEKSKKPKKSTKGKNKANIEDIFVQDSAEMVKPNVLPASLDVSFKKLCANDRIFIYSSIQIEELDPPKVIITLLMENIGTERLKNLEVFVLESSAVSLQSEKEGTIKLPFELVPKGSNQVDLKLNVNNANQTQRVRCSLSYLVEEGGGDTVTEKLDFKLEIRSILFLKFATIGSSSFEFMITSGELLSSATPSVETRCNFFDIVDGLTSESNFSIVEKTETAATLYAHSFDSKPICALLKYKDSTCSVCCKCSDQEWGQSLAEDLAQLIKLLPQKN
ncbi:unnamed protein product [Bursaphelenchus okinawaensis]|uniref:AP-3 complex subunit delta n=1 Tax=Bursaphelenchus okinawaensis TaxID=465554 RepID=A0A811KVR0_9BILA|nr:unnamed protein product [Bursaphelenchus okinawaensis]CAG9112624.1 unnamed protein product [Bursaphelenchus okinawaensis]